MASGNSHQTAGGPALKRYRSAQADDRPKIPGTPEWILASNSVERGTLRVDVFFGPFLAGAGPGTQGDLVSEASQGANAYLEAGADCAYPIGLWELDALRPFLAEVNGPVNVVPTPQSPSLAELAALGIARCSANLSPAPSSRAIEVGDAPTPHRAFARFSLRSVA